MSLKHMYKFSIVPEINQNYAVFLQPLRHSQRMLKELMNKAIMWRSLEKNNSPELDPKLFGWI